MRSLHKSRPITLMRYFNPRTPLQSAIRQIIRLAVIAPNFNPRTPLQSAIPPLSGITSDHCNFNPRTPLQSAIFAHSVHRLVDPVISIHALRYRVRLHFSLTKLCLALYFNPRTPLQSAIARYCGSSLKYSFSMQSCD